MSDKMLKSPDVLRAFAGYDRQVTIANFKIACGLGMVLMPLGGWLDHVVYPPELADYFLKLRFLSSALIAIFLGVLLTEIGKKRYRILGVTLFMIPASFIAWMIYKAEGAASPYYAGLNLVLLMLAFVLHWTFWESLTAATLILALYLAASFFHGGLDESARASLANNLYFLGLTGIIVVTGSYFHSKSRFREFALRYELDAEKKKTEQRNRELADAYQKLTEQESQIVQSQKMASVGQMSAGIIHEINNPLNFATTGLFTLRKKSKHLPAEQRAEYDDIVKDIEDGIGRVKNIVSDLRTFTHPNTDSLDQVVVSDVVASALRFLSNEVKDKAVIEQKLPAGQTVLANKNKLIHLFVNLIQNSLDALRTKPFPNGEQPTIWIEGRVQNGNSYLVVRDNGTGIPIDQVDKIYDPFFTTKAVGEGMGLGLSMCARIMKDSQGKISVRTEKGKFCEFTLEFPAPT